MTGSRGSVEGHASLEREVVEAISQELFSEGIGAHHNLPVPVGIKPDPRDFAFPHLERCASTDGQSGSPRRSKSQKLYFELQPQLADAVKSHRRKRATELYPRVRAAMTKLLKPPRKQRSMGL